MNEHWHATAFVHDSADVHASATLDEGAKAWAGVQVRERAKIGAFTNLGKGAFIDTDVELGANCKVQNYVNVFHGATVEDGVFLGPACMLLNDKNPRAINPDGSRKTADDWQVSGVTVRYGAAIGGGAVVLPGVTIGRWALIGSGAVVTKDVPDHGVIVGNPGRLVGYASPAGELMRIIDRTVTHTLWKASSGFELAVPHCQPCSSHIASVHTPIAVSAS